MRRSRLTRKPPKPRPVDAVKLKRSNPKRRSGVANPNSRGWTQRAFALYGPICLACPNNKRTRAVQAHHIVPRQRIAKDARKSQEERDSLEYDARNSFPICELCHTRHERGVKRIPRSRLPALAVQWAEEHDYSYVLEPPVYP